MVRSILTYSIGADNNPPVLQEETRRVTDFQSDEVLDCIRDLTDTLDDFISRNGNKRGISGLSATQIGIDLAISAVRTTEKLYIMINPVVIKELGKQRLFRIGCFSLFEYRAMVHYNDDIVIEYYDENGLLQQEEFTGDRSCIMQHEIDHLHGLLLFERLPQKEKDLFIPGELNKDSFVPVTQIYSGLFNDYSDYTDFIQKDSIKYSSLIDTVIKDTPKNGPVLEIGNGPSTVSIILNKQGYDSTCIQIDNDMLDMDKRISKENNSQVKYYLMDEYTSPPKFDTIFSSELFQSLNDEDLLSELKKWKSCCNSLIIRVPYDTSVDVSGKIIFRSIDDWRKLVNQTVSYSKNVAPDNEQNVLIITIQ